MLDDIVHQLRCCSVAKSCLTLCDPMDCSTPGFPVHHHLPEFAQTHVHWVADTNHLILCHSLLLPSVFPSIRVFSSESALCIRWPKYWSLGFNISPSNGYSGLISFRIDWFDVLVVQGTSIVFQLKKTTQNTERMDDFPPSSPQRTLLRNVSMWPLETSYTTEQPVVPSSDIGARSVKTHPLSVCFPFLLPQCPVLLPLFFLEYVFFW